MSTFKGKKGKERKKGEKGKNKKRLDDVLKENNITFMFLRNSEGMIFFSMETFFL